MTKERPIGLYFASALVALEGLFLGFLASQLGWALISGESLSFATSAALFVLVAGAAAWILFVAFNLLMGKRWARSAAVFWQLVQLAIASASFGGQFGSQEIGWAIALPSALVLATLFTKKVVAATMRQTDADAPTDPDENSKA